MTNKTTDAQQSIERTQAALLLESMKRQQAGLEQQADAILEQLTMTKGAVQILEELLRVSQDNQTEVKTDGNT